MPNPISDFCRSEGVTRKQLARLLTAAGYPVTEHAVKKWGREYPINARMALALDRATSGRLRAADLAPVEVGQLLAIARGEAA